MRENKAIIFDLDGVIVDTAKYHYIAWGNLAKSLGIDFSHDQNEQLKGVSRRRSLETILDWGNLTLEEEEILQLMSQKNKDYLGYIKKMQEDEVLPNVVKTLNYIESIGVPMALGSASKNAKAILKKVKLYDKFETIVDGNQVVKGKPNPEIFITAATRLGKNPEDCVVFEDARAGIKAANAAKMVSVGIGDKKSLKDADFCFKDFTEIDTNFIDHLVNSSYKDLKKTKSSAPKTAFPKA